MLGALEIKIAAWDEVSDVKQMWEAVEQTLVVSTREVYNFKDGEKEPRVTGGIISLKKQLRRKSLYGMIFWDLRMRL